MTHKNVYLEFSLEVVLSKTNQILLAAKACCRTLNLERGKQIHAEAVDCGQDSNMYIANALVNMYGRCGHMADAREVFDGIKHLTVVSWTALIFGYAANGEGHTALEMFARMRTEGPLPNAVTFVASLKACISLASSEECRNRGKTIHSIAVESGYSSSDVYVQSTLVDMYAKCGSMVDAQEMFDNVKHPNVVTWNVLILGYVDNGQGHIALDNFDKMRKEGPAPTSITLGAALKACISFVVEDRAECRDRGKEIHKLVVENGCNSDVFVQSTLVDMYAKCGSLMDAHEVFEGIVHPTVVSWNVLILGYADNGQGQTALDMFTRMRSEGLTPDLVTLLAALKSCASVAVQEGASQWEECRGKGKELHNVAVEKIWNTDVYVQSTLIDMYAKCGSMADSREVFEYMKHPDTVSWSALILGYADNGQGHTALEMFSRMRTEALAANSVTLVAALKSCTSLSVTERDSRRERIKEIHNVAVENGYNSDVYVRSTLIDMYAKCGSMVNAREEFDAMKHPTVVCWTALISGYADNGQRRIALDIFSKMRNAGPELNSVTLVAALKACTLAVKEGQKCRTMGKIIHSISVGNACNSDVYVQSTLLDMYAKCGSMLDAAEVFRSMKRPTLVSWTALISGYADNGQGHTALEMLSRMRAEGPAPDFVTFGAALKACGLVGALEFGRKIHSEIDNKGNDLDVVLVTSLVDFYAKCGSLVEAEIFFDLHAETRSMITWKALLAGFSSCGDSDAVFRLFEGMKDAGFKPDGIAFLCILTCCSHVGLVVKGKECFDAMPTKYGVIPTVKHYTCMIDLFGRSNKLDDAMAMLGSMPCSPDDVTWRTILCFCCKWKNVEFGRLAFQSLIDLNDRDVTAYVLMAQIYGSRGMLREVEMLMDVKKKLKAYENPGETCWTNEAGHVHVFSVDDCQHPQIQQMRDKWEALTTVLMRPRLPSDIMFEKEALCGHSERLALVFALINTEPGRTIRITKNSRVCDDCHIAIVLISKLESRTIFCRDASRMHIFRAGKCSCGDSW